MRVIQVGVGGYGGSWIHAVMEVEGYRHIALVDPSEEAMEWAARTANIPPERQFQRVEDALEACAGEADALLDITPAPLHHRTSGLAMKHGLHVLAEKPLADNMASAVSLVRLAQETRRTLMVTQQYRYQHQPRKIRQLIDEGAIGELDHMVVEFQIQGLLFGWRQQMDHPFLMDMAVHHFDLMRYILGRNARRVTAQTWNPRVSNTKGDMNAFVLMEFEGGVHVNYTGTFASPGTDTGWNGRWVITGTKGSIVWNPRDEWGPIRLFRQDADLSQYDKMHFFTPLPEVWGQPVWPDNHGATGHHYDLYHWRDCIQREVEPETSGRDNLNTLALTFAAIESVETGRSVEVASTFDLQATEHEITV